MESEKDHGYDAANEGAIVPYDAGSRNAEDGGGSNRNAQGRGGRAGAGFGRGACGRGGRGGRWWKLDPKSDMRLRQAWNCNCAVQTTGAGTSPGTQFL